MAITKKDKNTYIFPSSIEYLEKIEAISEKIAAKAGMDESASDDLSIAVTELVNNAIHHGNKDDKSKKVTVTFFPGKKQIKVSISDEGNGFNPSKVKDPVAPENLLAESGRGIYLVEALMDDLKINLTGSGTEIIIIKKF
ncbi:MAG: ATP-binding protein [Calditrichaceae bacterium]